MKLKHIDHSALNTLFPSAYSAKSDFVKRYPLPVSFQGRRLVGRFCLKLIFYVSVIAFCFILFQGESLSFASSLTSNLSLAQNPSLSASVNHASAALSGSDASAALSGSDAGVSASGIDSSASVSGNHSGKAAKGIERLLQEGFYSEAIVGLESELIEKESASGYFNLALAQLKLATSTVQAPSAENTPDGPIEVKNESSHQSDGSQVKKSLSGSVVAPSVAGGTSVVKSPQSAIIEQTHRLRHLSPVEKEDLFSKSYFNFLHAKRLSPRSSDVDYYLKEFEAGNSLATFQKSSLEKKFFIVGLFLSERELWYVAALFMFFSSLFFFIPEIVRLNEASLRLRYVGGFLLLISSYFLVAAVRDGHLRERWAVSRTSTSMRSQPNPDGEVMKEISKTSAVRVIRSNEFWIFAQLSSGEKGWVKKDDLWYPTDL